MTEKLQLERQKQDEIAKAKKERQAETKQVDINKTEAKSELLKLFNTIAEQENEIDAVLVTTYIGGRVQLFLSSQPKLQRPVEIELFPIIIRSFIPLLENTPKKTGVFDYSIFQFSNAIIHITHLPKYGEYTFILFVSATAEGIEIFEEYRYRYIYKIIELLDYYHAL